MIEGCVVKPLRNDKGSIHGYLPRYHQEKKKKKKKKKK